MVNRTVCMFVMIFIFGIYLVGVFSDLSVTDDEISINIVDTTFTEKNVHLVEAEPKMKQTNNTHIKNHYYQFPNRITDNISWPIRGQSTGGHIKKKFVHSTSKFLDDTILKNEIFYLTESSDSDVSSIEIPGKITDIVSGNETKCLGRKFSCINSTSVRVCSPSPVTHQYEEISQYACSDNTPYCDEITGTCVSPIESAVKYTRSASFTCLKDGYFPHPYDCSKYFLCLNYKSYELHCKQDYYYNFKTNSCDPYRYDKHCSMFNCKGYNGFKVPYSRDSSIYAYCIESKPYVITKCEEMQKLNITSQRCEPVCEHEGLIEDITDCTAYYKCVKTGFFYTKTSQKCVNNQGFDPFSFQCVSLFLLPGCNPDRKYN